MLNEPEGFELPEDKSKKIWRYMKFEKLENLEKKASLNFLRF